MFRKENFLDLKTWHGGVHAFQWGFFTRKEDLLVSKMDAEQLTHEIYATVRSKKPRQKQMQRTGMNRELYRSTR